MAFVFDGIPVKHLYDIEKDLDSDVELEEKDGE